MLKLAGSHVCGVSGNTWTLPLRRMFSTMTRNFFRVTRLSPITWRTTSDISIALALSETNRARSTASSSPTRCAHIELHRSDVASNFSHEIVDDVLIISRSEPFREKRGHFGGDFALNGRNDLYVHFARSRLS